MNLLSLLQENPLQFFELRNHVSATLRKEHKHLLPAQQDRLRARAAEIRKILVGTLEYCPLDRLSQEDQRQVMKWIFRNEDAVWRLRGGRPDEETVDSFLEMLQVDARCAYPGSIIRSAFGSERKIVGYLVGQLAPMEGGAAQQHNYEIVTAWVDPAFRGLNLAIHMYNECFQRVSSFPSVAHIFFDIIDTSFLQIVRANPLFRLISRLHLDRLLIVHRGHQYKTTIADNRATGEPTVENFERFILSAPVLRWSYTLSRHPRLVLMLCSLAVALIAILIHILGFPIALFMFAILCILSGLFYFHFIMK